MILKLFEELNQNDEVTAAKIKLNIYVSSLGRILECKESKNMFQNSSLHGSSKLSVSLCSLLIWSCVSLGPLSQVKGFFSCSLRHVSDF